MQPIERRQMVCHVCYEFQIFSTLRPHEALGGVTHCVMDIGVHALRSVWENSHFGARPPTRSLCGGVIGMKIDMGNPRKVVHNVIKSTFEVLN